jgi:CheY-like chemotaxis protein
MGGEIGCESVVGQGTHYWFVLPAGRARMAPPAPKPETDAQSQPNLSGHVLVVEDNAVNRMLIVTYLDEFGLTHEVVTTGGAAVMSLASKTYDLVLMDTAMRDLDGVETTRRIRSLHAPSSHVPIVALVAHGMQSDSGAISPPAWMPMCRSRSAGVSFTPCWHRSSAAPRKSRSLGWSKASLGRPLPV